MATFDLFKDILLRHEGCAYVADDHGRGPSKWRITLQTARESEPSWTADTILNLSADQAAAFYQVHFWDRYHIGLLNSQDVANKVCDLAVNVGPGTAIKFLQRAVGTKDDGVLGPATAAAANAVDPDMLLAQIKEAGEHYYRDVAAAHPEWADNLNGWLARLSANA